MLTVEKYYGTIIDMPTQGDKYNVELTLASHGHGNIFDVVSKYYRVGE